VNRAIAATMLPEPAVDSILCRACWCAAVGGLLLLLGPRVAAQSSAQPHFVRGLTALHTFEYEDANEAFREAQRVDPDFAMAFWGEAMTYNQTLWRKEDISAARRTLNRLASSPAARAAKATTPTEKAFIEAVETLFGQGDPATRHRQYADAMARLYERDGDNPDVASFYALALLGTMSRSLIGHEDVREGHAHGLAGSEVQTRVAAILEKTLQSHPDHLGALHYLLHNYDDPEHARLGLAAARTLEKLAPDSSHARHMPAHIFLQLGMWRDAASADRAAFEASSAWIARRNLPPTLRNYHALAWLEYELLQRGRYREAWETIGEIEPIVKATGSVPLQSDLSSMRARFVIETRRWQLLAGQRNFANVDDLFAIGVSAARTRDMNLAETARQALAERAQSEREGDLRPAIAIMEREVAALIRLAAGRTDEAIEMLRNAMRDELALPPPLGLPEPVKPATELLGEVLLESGRPREAVEPFEHALRRNPNRTLSVLGLARAAAALGDTATARIRYRELLANFDDADSDLPELAEARRALAQPAAAPPSSVSRGVVMIAVIGLVAAGCAALIVVRRRGKNRRRNGKGRKAKRSA
jgi:tetratricopeptide (TPR) repeat protein